MKGREISKDDLIHEIELIIKAEKEINIKKSLNTKMDVDTKILRYYIFLRTHMAETQMINTAMIKRHFMRLSKGQRRILEALEYMVSQEIKSTIKGEKLNYDRIRNRKRGYLLIKSKDIEIIDGVEYEKIKEQFLIKEKNINKQIKGSVANKGIVIGRVKIILNQSDFYKVEKGDIIVAPSTTPNFIVIMSKASAFVTDEGGIASHAAIISREMNKPCIVGTKNATSILKDGDKVEIDANKGIVTKL